MGSENVPGASLKKTTGEPTPVSIPDEESENLAELLELGYACSWPPAALWDSGPPGHLPVSYTDNPPCTPPPQPNLSCPLPSSPNIRKLKTVYGGFYGPGNQMELPQLSECLLPQTWQPKGLHT